MLPLSVTSEKEINHQSHNRQEEKHHQPRNSLNRLPVLKHHDQHLAQDDKEVEGPYYTINYDIKHGLIRLYRNKHTKKD